MSGETKDFTIILKKEKGSDIPIMVVEQMISLISNGTLKPGDKLPSELEMTRRFNISRISLREAIKLLEAKGFVESKGRRGKFIRAVTDTAIPLSLAEIIRTDTTNAEQLYRVKTLILSEAAALASGKISTAAIDRMNSTLESIKRSSSPVESIALYKKFFTSISESAGNTFYTHLNESLAAPLYKATEEKGKSLAVGPSSREVITSQMSQIVGALTNGSPEEARTSVKGHLDHLGRALFS